MIKTLYEPFRHWSEGKQVLIISDTHFGDPDCRLIDKDWPSPDEHVDNINCRINNAKATLIHLGDVGDPTHISRIKAAHKVLILGNHDAGASAYRGFFDEVYSGPLMIAPKIMLSHEPVDVPFAVNLHGHVHGGLKRPDLNHFNCCSDVRAYEPVDLDRLIKDGVMSPVRDIHRLYLDSRTEGKDIAEAVRGEHHKYLNDLGLKSDNTVIFNSYDVENGLRTGRTELFADQRDTYGFDERETWALEFTMMTWLYSHLRMYADRASTIVNLEYHRFDIPVLEEIPPDEYEYTYGNFPDEYYRTETHSDVTQKEAIDLACEYIKEYILNSESCDPEKERRATTKGQCALKIVAEILPALWW